MNDFSQFEQRSADWRGQLKKNAAKTRWVIATFIFIYVALGLVIDVFLYSEQYRATTGQILQALLTFKVFPYATLTMGGVAIIALWVTYAFSNRLMLMGTNAHEVTRNSRDLQEQQLYNVIEEMKVAAGMNYMPKVFIIEADYMNAFASGYSEKSAMVAITRGLLAKLDRAEVTAVMAHELSHIRHRDIKLTLTVAVLSNIMLIIIDLLFYNMIFGRRNRNGDNRIFIVVIVLRDLLPFITVLLTLYLSRTREYMADAGCVELMRDNGPMARALMKIDQDHQQHAQQYAQEYGKTPHEDVRRAAYLYDPVKAGIEPVKSISSLFSTHPTIRDRLKAIGFVRNNADKAN